ncbi:hypothetical protein [Oceanobacillus sp. J11TS1]|uniref:hypothetical protein n=1 Tax=Oceanobacillus sp. J11TS1 TaxID=2807191 RepID=UPI001AFDC71E|nr:hypothetical protein [Oceanobacillus sp. J11TS1]GIO22445.1 hypothetical protein J11TS1_10260 [Oceanobacillus sp. J11TS1]
MAKVELSVLFKKIQKDDKKEVLEFHVQGEELPSSQELVNMAGGMAHLTLQVDKQDIENFPAEYKNIQRDSKKTKLLFNIKGDTEDKVIKLYPFAGHNVTLFVEPSQMSVEDFENENTHKGMPYQVEKDGTVQVEGQVSMDDIPNENEDSEELKEKEETISDDELPDFDINDPDFLLD